MGMMKNVTSSINSSEKVPNLPVINFFGGRVMLRGGDSK
jgi:hypothetical protein